MGQAYIGQTKTPEGIIFHYVGKNHKVESDYYTREELDKLSMSV